MDNLDFPSERSQKFSRCWTGTVHARTSARGFRVSLHDWRLTPGQFRGMNGIHFRALGIPTEEEYVACI